MTIPDTNQIIILIILIISTTTAQRHTAIQCCDCEGFAPALGSFLAAGNYSKSLCSYIFY